MLNIAEINANTVKQIFAEADKVSATIDTLSEEGEHFKAHLAFTRSEALYDKGLRIQQDERISNS